jgi:hypothetical protein
MPGAYKVSKIEGDSRGFSSINTARHNQHSYDPTCVTSQG